MTQSAPSDRPGTPGGTDLKPSGPTADEAAARSMRKAKMRSFALTVLAPVAAFVIALIVIMIVVLASGRGIDEVFDRIGITMAEGRNIIDLINKAGMYYISAIAVAIGFRMNLFNIGVEGQYRLAAVVAAYVGASVNNLPGILHILVILVTAMVTGAIWAGIAGILKVTRGVSEVISTIMLNAIAAAMIGFLLRDGGFSPDPAGRKPSTAPIDESGWFPSLNGLINPLLDLLGFKAPPPSARTYGFILVAILLGIVYSLMLSRTRFGFDLRSSGQNPEAAQASGVSAKRMTLYAMLMSGAVAGLVGMPELLGARQHSFSESFIAGIGWAGISVALLGRNHPFGMFIASFVWAFLDVATRGFGVIGISNKLSSIMQGVVLLSVVVAYTVVSRKAKAAEARAVAANTEPHPGAANGAPPGSPPDTGPPPEPGTTTAPEASSTDAEPGSSTNEPGEESR